MKPRTNRGRLWTAMTGAALCTAAWAAAGLAQETVRITGDDRILASDFPEVYRVGSMDGAAWETFGEVGGVAFDGAGHLYVFDRQSARIVKVAPDGSFAGEVGRAGEGPGELRGPHSFTVLRDGTVVVADLGHRAYTLYGPDGSYLRSVSMGADGGVLRIGDLIADPSGGGVFSAGGSVSMSVRGGPGEEPAPPVNRPVEHIDLSGEVARARTVVEAWLPPRDDRPLTLRSEGASFRMAMASPRTFEPGLFVAALPDGGIAYADSSTWTVRITGADGRLRRMLVRPYRPLRVTERMQEAERARALAELEAGGGPQVRIVVAGPGGRQQAMPQEQIREMLRGRVEQMRFYPELPVIRAMRGGWSGKLWVQRRGEKPHLPGPVDVVTPEGRYVGTLPPEALPDAFGPDGLAAWVELDELDVPTVVVRRLPAVLR